MMHLVLPTLEEFEKGVRELCDYRLAAWHLAIAMLLTGDLVDNTNKALLISAAINAERQRRQQVSTS